MKNFSFGGKRHRTSGNHRNLAAAGHKPRSSRRDLQMETLEDRSLLAVNPLVISEINYHPTVPYSGAFDKDQYEFVELYNAGGTPLQLAGVTFQARTGATTNIIVTIGSRILEPGDYALLVRNSTAMQERYGAGISSKIAASWSAARTLANFGNTIRLQTPVGINENTLIQFTYNDGGDTGEEFPNRPDGYGATLELVEPSAALVQTYYANPINWNASEEYLGSPGRAGKPGLDPRVVINEILANSNHFIPEIDKLELVNVSDDPVDLGGWMITDNDDNPVGIAEHLQAYVIPFGTILRPGEYITLDESQFNSPGANNGIALSSRGETLYLISREQDGTQRFEDVVEFKSTRTSQSIGRVPDSTGSFLPMTTQTFGAANSSHEISPLVITEVMYKRWTPNPDLNFIELYNRTNAAVNVGSWTGWNLTGVSYTFPNGSSIAANTAVVLVSFNLADATKLSAFRNTYSIPATVPIFSWFKTTDPGNLSDNGEPLGLYWPFVDGTIPVPKVLVDYVDFNDTSPWPEGPAGGIAGASYSLTRLSPDSIGDLPHSWRGALPSPGTLTFPTAASLLDGLVISEVMYNPLPAGFDDQGNPISNNSLEFVELYNSTGSTLNLAQAGIGDGVEFRFLPGTTVASGERIVVVPFNPAIASVPRDEFFGRYGSSLEEVRLFGPWSRSLSKNGEHLALADALGNTFFEVTYSDDGGWPRRADGRGSSLELIDPNGVPAGVDAAAAYLNDHAHWRASREIWGSPGTAGSGPLVASVVINEILAHTDAPFTDAIELLNVSNAPVELIDWALTDDMTKNPATSLFILPRVTLNPGESITFDAGPTGFGEQFGLSGTDGEQVYLVGYDEQAQRVVFVDEVEFPAAFNGVSLGRWPNGSGPMFPMQSRTLSQFDTTPTPGNVYTNGANSGPAISDIVISEIMYNASGASAADFEFIELLNRTNLPVSLGPIEDGNGWADSQPQGWRIKGAVDFEFGTEHVIPAAGTLIAVSFDPLQTPTKLATFRERYGVAANVPIVGPFERWRWIPDDGGEIRLDRPDFAPADLPLSERFTPNVLVDRVTYDDVAPWPTSADGHGQSLSRVSNTRFGDFADSWNATDPTPGFYSPSGPRVTSVVLSGSAWTDEFVSAVSAGNSTARGYAIPTGSQQLTPVPWTHIDQVSITFDRDVTVLPYALSVVGSAAQTYSAAVMPDYDPATFTATWHLSQPIGRDQLLLKLSDAKVYADGVALDGEWANAWPANVSGNGLPGGAFLFSFVVDPGDVNQDGLVGDSDLRGVLTAAFATVGTAKYQPTYDLDGSGHINHVDAIFARNQRQLSPVSAPASMVRRANLTMAQAPATPRRQLRAADVDRAMSDSLEALRNNTAEQPLRVVVGRRGGASAVTPRLRLR